MAASATQWRCIPGFLGDVASAAGLGPKCLINTLKLTLEFNGAKKAANSVTQCFLYVLYCNLFVMLLLITPTSFFQLLWSSRPQPSKIRISESSWTAFTCLRREQCWNRNSESYTCTQRSDNPPVLQTSTCFLCHCIFVPFQIILPNVLLLCFIKTFDVELIAGHHLTPASIS